jgi:hypothetical protein
MKKILAASLVLSFLSLGAALAQKSPVDKSAPQVRYKQVTNYEFDNDQVEGATLRPDGEMVGGIKKGRPTSLVKARQHFTPEMLKSVEGL